MIKTNRYEIELGETSAVIKRKDGNETVLSGEAYKCFFAGLHEAVKRAGINYFIDRYLKEMEASI